MATTMKEPVADFPSDGSPNALKQAKKTRPKRPNYHFIHRNLLPREVHPLPVLIPHNPLSLIAVALSYLTQLVTSRSPQPTYCGYFSSATSSVHITEPVAIRRLWEMGFFGKGSLSRSEPTWLESQGKQGETSEKATHKRRDERRALKLERARKEHEAVEQRLKEEQGLNGAAMKINKQGSDDIFTILESSPMTPEAATDVNGSFRAHNERRKSIGSDGANSRRPTSTTSEANSENSQLIKKQVGGKSVRFSPTIEAREFDLSSPIISPIKDPGPSPLLEQTPAPAPVDENQEHLQLAQEEAFFLAYTLGVLKLYADDSDILLPIASLLALFRRHSYHPPRSLSAPAEPDDPFMLSYTAYHHYRSLGWVVRCGVKFSVDYLLYNMGPAFSHAEFAVTILPSYSHPHWSSREEHMRTAQRKSRPDWWWLHCVNRVQSQVKKNLMLCYVDIPPPLQEHEKAIQNDPTRLFARYKVRDVGIKRWIPNRSRD